MAITSFLTYLELEKNYAAHTLTAYRDDLENFQAFCLEVFQEDDLGSVSYSLIRSWIVQLLEQGNSTKTINRKISSLRSYYKYLMRSEQIEKSPLDEHRPLKVQKNVQVPFSQKEMHQVLDPNLYPDSPLGTLQRVLITTLYYTGMRRTELIHLLDRDVSLDNRTIKVVGKRNKERLIPVLQSLQKHLLDYRITRADAVDTHGRYFFRSIAGKKLSEHFVYETLLR